MRTAAELTPAGAAACAPELRFGCVRVRRRRGRREEEEERGRRRREGGEEARRVLETCQ